MALRRGATRYLALTRRQLGQQQQQQPIGGGSGAMLLQHQAGCPCCSLSAVHAQRQPYCQPSRSWSASTTTPHLTLHQSNTLQSLGMANIMPGWRLMSVTAVAAPLGGIVSFPLAQTGEGISECELLQWFVKEGDVVAEFDKLCEVQSDKATIEITSRYKGRIAKLHHDKGDIVKVGAMLADIDTGDGSQPTTGMEGSASASLTVPARLDQDAPAPAGAPGGASAAASTAVEGPADGSEVEAGVNEEASVLLEGRAAAAAAAAAPSAGAGDAWVPASQVAAGGDRVLTSPAVRALAREHNVPLGAVQGSGRDGRVLKEDVLRYLEQQAAAAASNPGLQSAAAVAAAVARAAAAVAGPARAPAAPAPPAPAAPSPAGATAVAPAAADVASNVVPLRGFRRAMVKSMTVVASVPHFHYMDEVTVDALMAVRAALATDPTLRGVKLTMLPLLVKALSVALLDHPHVNASLAASGTDLVLHPDHNIGVAMAAPGGLVVPNIKNVQALSVAEVAFQLQRLQVQAAANQLSASDVAGGTISISNIGTIGGIHATPLVNPPEVAIVALGRVQKLPRYNEAGQVVPRSLLPISWGADHRVVDGAGLARLSNSWKLLLEEPARLLLQLR